MAELESDNQKCETKVSKGVRERVTYIIKAISVFLGNAYKVRDYETIRDAMIEAQGSSLLAEVDNKTRTSMTPDETANVLFAIWRDCKRNPEESPSLPIEPTDITSNTEQ